MLDVCLLGTAGMMPLPHRWLTAALMRYNGSNLLIDCGEGTQIAIKEKGWTFKPIDVICFTHYHADHISGLPGLLLTMGNAERTEPLTMIGPKGLEKVVSALRMIAPELPFEIRYIELTGPEEDMEINGYHIHAFKVNHNMDTQSRSDVPDDSMWNEPETIIFHRNCGIHYKKVRQSQRRMELLLPRTWCLEHREKESR